MQSKSFNVDVYNFKVHVTNKLSCAEKIVGVAIDPQTPFGTFEYHSTEILIYIGHEYEEFYDHRYLQCVTHECTHAALSILDIIGVKKTDQEVLAYLQDYIFRKTLDSLKQLRGKK